MSIDVGEVASDEIPNLPAFAAHHPHQHAMTSRLPYFFHRPCHENKMRTYSQFVKRGTRARLRTIPDRLSSAIVCNLYTCIGEKITTMTNGRWSGALTTTLFHIAFFLIGLAVASMLASFIIVTAAGGPVMFADFGEEPDGMLFLVTFLGSFIGLFSFLPAAFVTALCSKRQQHTPTPFLAIGALVAAVGCALFSIEWIPALIVIVMTGCISALAFWFISVHITNRVWAS
jgi:hypothetical protein